MRDEIISLYLDDIIPNRFQPREKFNQEKLNELALSIKEHGVIQPIVVRQIGEKYEIIAGERRYKASAIAGLTKVPAIIRNLDDKEASKVALLENLQRQDLTAIEEARTYQKILELDSMTQEELGKTMGKSQAAIANKIRLLSLTDEVQEALLNEQISERHARSLLTVTDPNLQVKLLNDIIGERMTVRELDQRIKIANEKKALEGIKQEETTTSETPIGEEQPIIVEEQPKFISDEPEGVEEQQFIPKEQPEIQEPAIEIPQPETQDIPRALEEQPIDLKAQIKNTFIESLDDEPEIEIQNETKKYEKAINAIKENVDKYKEEGVNINYQEYDLVNRMQIVININKE